ncbi:hypothetical protein NBRC110019_27790 [Neptunitalea chrysea]|uniref:Glycosyl transferase family 1 domain-containing protein n=1 Tax=Neptunitalea chrysea TaxID=1647581 RepID=A0A9W6EWV0_9FLAO|nr:hypothetical protein NBRC110019_27790 [Neptunitalea chrysea]
MVDCLATGGAERTAANLSIEFYNLGFQVIIISLLDEVNYNYKGTLINLGKKRGGNKVIRNIAKGARLSSILKKQTPDCIIDFRMRNNLVREFLLYQFIFRNYVMIYRINSAKVDWHIPKGSFFKKVYSKSNVVAVSKSIEGALKTTLGFSNVSYIPNFFKKSQNTTFDRPSDVPEEYILAVGSLRNNIKQFDKLLDIYADSKLPEKEIALVVLGEGEDYESLQQQIADLNLKEKVLLLGRKEQIEGYVKRARFLVLSSALEGFPNVILESLSLGTPVVSFDCVSGPSEMIIDKENGLLVQNQDFDELRNAIDLMVEDTNLYLKCKANTDITLSAFSKEVVLQKWLEILQ